MQTKQYKLTISTIVDKLVDNRFEQKLNYKEEKNLQERLDNLMQTVNNILYIREVVQKKD